MNFNQINKQEKFSIRKYKSVGVASAMIGTLFFLSSGSIVSAHESTPSNEEAIVQPKNIGDTVRSNTDADSSMPVELDHKVSEAPVSETDAKSSETKDASSEKDQPIDTVRTTALRTSDQSATDTSSIANKSDVETKPNEKQLNRMNNYDPKWDHIDENGNIIRDLNKYSDPNFNKEELLDSEDNPVKNDESSSDAKPDSDVVVETSKPVDESKFEFKTSWEDTSVEDKSGIRNSQSNSLIGTYSGTEVAKNLYVTMKSSEGYEFTPSSASSKVGTLEDGTNVYEISSLNGGSQFEFKTTPSRTNAMKNNGDSDTFEYKVYNSLTKLNKNNLAEGLSKSKLLYSKELHYTYTGLKQAGYELTDKYESVVKNNVPADDAYRNVNLGIYNTNNGRPIETFNYVEIKTGLNNDAYTSDSNFGEKVYSLSDGIAKVDHDSETITVSGLPDGVTPLVNHEDLGNGSYKIKMNDFLNQPHGSTTLALKYTDEFFKSTFGHNVKIKPEYKIERINKDGKTFVQVVKDSYDFNLYSKDFTNEGEFVHNVLNPANEFEKYSDNRSQPGEYVTVVNANSKSLKMVSSFKHTGDASTEKTLIYSLSGANSHFTDIGNVDADVYAYSNDKWTYVGKGDSNSENNGYLKLLENSKKVALSYKSLSPGERKPLFKTELDDVKAFKNDTSTANRFLDMNVQIFNEPDAVTYLTNQEIDDVPKTLVDRLLLLNEEKWNYHFSTPEDTNELHRSPGEKLISSSLNWKSNGDSDEYSGHPSIDDIYYFAKINKDLLKFNPSFNESTKIISEKDLSDGSRLYLFKLNEKNNDSDLSRSLSTKLQFDGISPVNSQIVFGKIDKYVSEDSNNNGFTLSENKLNYNGDSVDIGQNLNGYNVETSVVNVKFEPLRESFSKLELSEIKPYITGAGKTVHPYELIGSSTNASDTEKTIKTAIMTIPKASGGTILNLKEHLLSNDDVTYYYELNGSGEFVKASNDVNLKDITKVKAEYSKPHKITVDDPWVWKLPLVLDEKSTSDKTANGYLEFDNANNEHFVTNSVEVNESFENELKNGILNFIYSYLNYKYSDDDGLLGNYLSKIEFKSKPNTFNLKSDNRNLKIGDYSYQSIRALGGHRSIGSLVAGTDGFAKFDPERSFENSRSEGGHSKYARRSIENNIIDVSGNEYILRYVLKQDKNRNYSKLEKTDILKLSDDWAIVPVYELQVKPEFRGYVYRSDVDSKDPEERHKFYNDMIDSNGVKLLYSESSNTLEHVGDSITKEYREIAPRVEVEENDRFKRTRTYTYTYHKLNDIDGFKDDGTRTVSNVGDSDSSVYTKYGLFFYDEHIDEKIEWKTKTLTVNYVDADTNKILNTYTVQRLKDEKIGEFDKSYIDYSYVRSDFTESDLMGDSNRAINMYFSRNTAILRTETYVDGTLLGSLDEYVDTFSPIRNNKPVSAIEYNGKLATYDSTEVENDAKLVGDKDSVTTIKHHYRTTSAITSPTVNMIFKDGDTVLGSAILKSNQSGDKLSWELVDSNSSDSFIDGILNRSIYKPADGQDWKPNGQFRTGEVTTEPDKLLYNVEFNVVKKEGRLTISYIDSKTGEKIISDEVYNPVVIGTEYNDIKPGLKLPSKEENVHQNGKLMKRLEFYVKSKDNKIDPVTIKEGDNNVVFKYDKIVSFVDVDVKYSTDFGDVPTADLPEYNGGAVPNETPIAEKPEYEGGAVPNESIVHILPEYEGGVVPNEAPIHEAPEYLGGVTPNEAPIAEKSEYEGGVVPNEAPIQESPEYSGGVTPNESPIHEVLEFDGSVVPIDSPIHEVPEFNGVVTPNDAPTHELPEFKGGVVPIDAPVQEIPALEVSATDHQKDVPSIETQHYDKIDASKDAAKSKDNSIKRLPNTGQSSDSAGVAGLMLASLAYFLKRKRS